MTHEKRDPAEPIRYTGYGRNSTNQPLADSATKQLELIAHVVNRCQPAWQQWAETVERHRPQD